MFGRSKDEIELLEASLAGNAQAFGTVIDRYASLICAITYSATGSVTESEELAQDTFLRAWKGLEQLKDLAKFRPWLCRIARSRVQNWYRSRTRDVASQVAPLEAAADKPSDESGPVETAMSHEQQAVVRQALAQIPQNLREPLILFYREQQSTREVALQLGLSENAARQRISRARAMLRVQVATMVERTIARTKPSKAFKTAVIAAIAGTAAQTGTATAAASLLGLGTKIALVAASVALLAGAVWVHRQTATPERDLSPLVPVASVSPAAPPSDESTLATTETVSAAMGAAPNPIDTEAVTTPQAKDLDRTGPTSRPRVTENTNQDATQFEFKPQGILSGMITDTETGQPVPGALVRIGKDLVFYARTDANGFYHFEEIHEAGNFAIAIDSTDYVDIPLDSRCPVISLSQNKQAVKHFQLPKACMVDLWVVDANGVGIEGARVVPTVPTDADPQEVSRIGTLRQTDANGYLLLGGFPPSETDYQITAWHTFKSRVEERDGTRYAYDSAPACTWLRLNDPNRIPQVQIVLEQGQDVHGYAEYADGVPASDIEVVARPAWWHCKYGVEGYPVNADGTFTIKHITPGLYDIWAHKLIGQMQLPPADDEPLLLRLPSKSPQSLASIGGTFVLLGQEKPRYIKIDAYSPSTGHHLTSAGYESSGVKDTFLIDRLEPGPYRLSFSGGQIEEKVIEGVIAPSSGLEVELMYTTKPALTGTVIDAQTGAPVASFQVRVRKLRTLRGRNYGQENQWVRFGDEHGGFSIETVGPGVYQVQVAAEGYAPTWSAEISTDDTDMMELALVRGGTIMGRIVDEEGEPISGAHVIPLSLAGGVMPRTRDEFVSEYGAVESVDGMFALKDVPPGVETLKITHPDYAFHLADIEVSQGQTTGDVEIVLTTGGIVEGIVYDDRGDPLAGEILRFEEGSGYSGLTNDEAGQWDNTVTDSDGFYRVSHLPEQLCYIKRNEEWRSLGVVRRTVVPRNGTVSRVDFGGTPTVAGTVLVQGVPLANARLLLGALDTPHFGPFKCYTMTDESGTFLFAGVQAGAHAIYREDPDKENGWLRIATVAVRDADVSIGVLEGRTPRLLVTLGTPDDATPWAITRLLLCDAGNLFGESQRMGRAPTEAGQPWTFVNIAAGTYTLLAHRADQIQWQTEITLDEGKDTWELSVPVPESTSQLSGDIAGAADEGLVLWREDKLIFGAIVPGPDGHFALDNLPGGRYLIGSALNFLHDTPALAEFRLEPHVSQTVDLDLLARPVEKVAHLVVQVVDEDGVARDDATVRLEGALGRIEPLHSSEIGHVFLTTPGRHRLSVEIAGYRRVEKDVALKVTPTEGGQPQTLRIVLEPL